MSAAITYRRSRGAFAVVDDFENALAEYTGAPYVVTVDSCTNALFLAMLSCRWGLSRSAPAWDRGVDVPRRTYVGVPQVVEQAGFRVRWVDLEWHGAYRLNPLPVVDSAKRFERGMWDPRVDHLVCVSFHVGKRLPLGRGGAILLGDVARADWLRRVRFDGRTIGETGERATKVTRPGWHMYLTPPEAARGLWLLEQFVDKPLADDWTHYPDVSALLA